MSPMRHLLSMMIVFMVSTLSLAQDVYRNETPWSVMQRYRQMQLEYIDHLKAQLAADPDNLARQLDLGRAYYWLAVEREAAAQFEAEKIFDQILARDPDNAIALAYHGSLLGLKIGYNLAPPEQAAALGQRAFAELDRAVALAPDSIEVRELRGYSYFYAPSFLGRDRLAVEDFTEILRLLEQHPGSEEQRAEIHLILGDTYSKMGDRARAQANWRRARQLAPHSRLTLAAAARLRSDELRKNADVVEVEQLVALFGFLIGTFIFAVLSFLVGRDLARARRRRKGMLASFLVSLAAFLWNGANMMMIVLHAVGGDTARPPGGESIGTWSGFSLIWALSPIPAGLIIAYRFYKATFMDIVLKRGAALLAIFLITLAYAELVEAPLSATLILVPDRTLQLILFTGLWLGVLAFYPPLRDRIYQLVDRHLFKRRDYSQLLDWFNDRLRAVTDEESLMNTVSETLKEAFATPTAHFLPPADALAVRLSEALSERRSQALLKRAISDDALYAELDRRRIELALTIGSLEAPMGVILVGPRAYGQDYLSEELSVLRTVAAQIERTLENLRLHEARRRQAIAEQELRKLAAEAELRALRAQIDPHFFFNALNSVAALIGEDPAAAEELITDLADLFRHAFKTNRAFVTLEQELDLVKTYVKVEKMRLGDKLRFRMEIAPTAQAVQIPALTIQPLIENAVKHGIEPAPGGGDITFSATVTAGYLRISVADTGVGISRSELSHILSRGVGLANVNDRLVRLYGEEAALHIDSLPGQGTTVSFAIPVGVEPATH